ncbi:MAG: DUF6268 family outer membrane beta-barrel protein [Candidatus Omnitrophica bacterium]|nr:DUF6268 family outer membrane beta-barrel protein [Candidatus Omnitrophota bacterium]
MARKKDVIILSIIAAFLFFTPLYAESEEKEESQAVSETEAVTKNPEFRRKPEHLITEEEEAPQNIYTYIRYMPERKVKAQSGKVTLIDSDVEYSYAFKAFEELPVGLSLDQRYIGIKNSTAVELPAHLVGLSTGLETTLPFFNFNKTYFRVAVYPSFYGDDWSFPSSSFRMPVHTFLIYQPNEKATFVLGVAVYPGYEDVVWPIVGVIYKPNDRLTFNLIPKEPNISYMLSDRITLFAEGDITLNEFEVTKDDLKNVVLQYKETHAGAGIKYRFNKFIYSSFSVGGIFNRSLKYRDSLGKVDIKSGLYTEFRLEIKI